jgi:hypothetical protein
MINGIKLAVFEKSMLLSFHQAYHSMEESLFLSLIMGLLGADAKAQLLSINPGICQQNISWLNLPASQWLHAIK